MNADANYIVLVVSDSNLNVKVDGPGFEDIESAIAHAEGITGDPQQRLNVAYIIPVDAVVVNGQRLLTLSSTDGQYAAGRQSVWDELAAKSNLPDDASHHVRKVRIDPAKVRKMPAHKTAAQLAEAAEKLQSKRSENTAAKFAGLSGLKLNLEVLKK